jgi:hypothetical protein
MEAKNPWTMRCYLFLNFVNVSYETLFLIFVFLEGLQLSMEWLTRGRQDLWGALQSSLHLVKLPHLSEGPELRKDARPCEAARRPAKASRREDKAARRPAKASSSDKKTI